VIGADGRGATVSAAVFAARVASMFGASALYHRVRGRRAPAPRCSRSSTTPAIYLLIAGTYTPFGLLVSERRVALDDPRRSCWTGRAAAIIAQDLRGARRRSGCPATIGIGLGWVGVVAFPQLSESASRARCWLVGRLCYTVGAIVYARRRPDPCRAPFGYHELFHLLVIGRGRVSMYVGDRVLRRWRGAPPG
jgi:hemolysin III